LTHLTLVSVVFRKVLLGALLLFLGFTSIRAQESTQYGFSWFDFEGGIGFQATYDAPTAGKFGWGLQINRHLITTHFGSVGDIFRYHAEVGLLYGRVLTPLDSKFMGGVSAGISYATQIETSFGLFGGKSGSSSAFHGVSIPVQAHLQYRMLKHIALGATLFSSINQEEPFGGLTVGILIGKFWP
jgi:hypothetical protein